MVDLSPSTRTATYRDPAALRGRIGQLLGRSPHRVVYFASESATTTTAPPGPTLPDLLADRTTFAPPAARAVLLFSDARFALPAFTPPTYIVVDAALDTVADASVEDLEVRGDELAVTVENAGPPRPLRIAGAGGSPADTAPTGAIVLTRPVASRPAEVVAQLAAGDPWPENDRLVGVVPPSERVERWWVGQADPGPGWRFFAPRALPGSEAAFLAPSVIVLDNVAATELSPAQQGRLRRYVDDLGGGLVILGGDRAFAAGGYAGSVLESLSPLASTPPEPTTHWLLLADSSGSMAGTVPGTGATRWRFAADAILGLLPALPPEDRVSVGGFAKELDWWVQDRAARDVVALKLPPAGTTPRGPTELEASLQAIAASAEPTGLPKQLLLMTDGAAEIDDARSLAASLQQKDIRLHLLAIGDAGGVGLPALRQITSDTGGTALVELDPRQWTAAVRRLMRSAAPDLFVREPLPVRFRIDLAALPPRSVSPWNRTWLKETAEALAEARTGGGETVFPVARSTGDRRVLAAAFGATPAQAEPFVRLVERPPRDPRYQVTWDAGAALRVTVDARADGGRYLNGERLSLRLVGDAGATAPPVRPIPQAGPGRYELLIDAPRRPAVAEVLAGGRVIDRRAIAGRYAPEFEAIGNDRRAMDNLAARTGGRVIEPQDTRPIELPWPRREVPLTPALSALGALFIALGLIRWRVS